ncbi:MAG: molybdopterin cofactor-binding domain-containing protein, partial [Halobacteriaceae archaeon]
RYEPLDAVIDPVAATTEDAPRLYEEVPNNIAVTNEMGDEDATDREFRAADNVIELDLKNNRLIPTALEPRAALATYDPGKETFTVKMTSQSPHGHRRKLAHTLGLPERKIRVISPDVGGGFGHKGHHHPGEAMAAWSAKLLDMPVKWTATRGENYRAGAHGRDHVTEAALAIDDDGTFRGLRADTYAGVGGQGIGGGPAMPGWYGRLLSGEYQIPAIYCTTRSVFTN